MNTCKNELFLHLAPVQIFMVKCGEWSGIMFIFLLIDFKRKEKTVDEKKERESE